MDTTIRTATTDDVGAISELVAARIGEEDAKEAEIVLEDQFFRDRWFVAEVDGQILSTAGVFPGQLDLGGVSIGAGAVEFVATDENAEGRGLVRRLMDEIHATAPSRGEMAQWIVGITYFYRKFGYEYAIPVDAGYSFDAADIPEMPSSWTVREIDEHEVGATATAQRKFSRQSDVALTAAERMWDVYRRSPVYEVVVADGPKGRGYGRIYTHEDDRYLFDVLADSSAAAAALLNAASASGAYDVTALGRPGASEHLDAHGPSEPSGDAYYLRVADPVALLDAMRPILSERLAAHDRSADGDALISLYGSSVRFKYGGGQVGPMRRGAAEHGPIGQGGSGVAPDRIVSLLLGPSGATALAEQNPDVNLGEQDELMNALFPPQSCDVHSWVFP